MPLLRVGKRNGFYSSPCTPAHGRINSESSASGDDLLTSSMTCKQPVSNTWQREIASDRPVRLRPSKNRLESYFAADHIKATDADELSRPSHTTATWSRSGHCFVWLCTGARTAWCCYSNEKLTVHITRYAVSRLVTLSVIEVRMGLGRGQVQILAQ